MKRTGQHFSACCPRLQKKPREPRRMEFFFQPVLLSLQKRNNYYLYCMQR
ncbi:hypothetical protein LMG29542_03795 [Paraburkholderia humisilvae]|uniref:Uncharacterized protein n=1 Tax=Paraburkholderia humisilvae TaxID=627669 RepID=A0A6J5E5B7_9BURK|nr:hypothetical protein LMG29542_03795 [Paraburkholderia humisilvae]